jgi:3-methyladenine DNA glycosylase AlkD
MPTNHTFLDSYLGNTHPRYSINAPTLRQIAREWKRDHRDLSATDFEKLITSLIKGKSSTEKMFAGMLLDVATPEQRKFNPAIFDQWLDYLVGWAEVDAVCTGKFTELEIPAHILEWKRLLLKLVKSKNINKRRASIVFLCSPLRTNPERQLADLALTLVDQLKGEKEILITKAISWVLRSMVPHHRRLLEVYIRENTDTLPSIAVRETRVKLDTGTKSGRSQNK